MKLAKGIEQRRDGYLYCSACQQTFLPNPLNKDELTGCPHGCHELGLSWSGASDQERIDAHKALIKQAAKRSK